MRSAFAVFLRGFTLPFGVVTGRRIVLDGDIGDIKLYDSLDDLRIRMGWPGNPDAIYFYLPDSALFPTDESRAGRISGTTLFIGGPSARGALEIVSPDLVTAGRDRMFLELACEANDGSQPPRADFYSDPSFARGDIRLDARSIPRGLLLNGRFRNTAADDVARAAGVNTDMAVTVAAIAGHAYEVTLNSHFTVGTAGANYGVDLWDGAATVGRFERRNPADTPAGSLLHYAGSTVDYFPTVTGNVTLTVRNAAGSGGTITMQRSTVGYRSLTVKHVGQV